MSKEFIILMYFKITQPISEAFKVTGLPIIEITLSLNIVNRPCVITMGGIHVNNSDMLNYVGNTILNK